MQTNTTPEVLQLAQQALADSPIYVEHIEGMLFDCAEALRIGDDQAALFQFARAADDLDQFTRLIDGIIAVAGQEQIPTTNAFTGDLRETLRDMESSLKEYDLVTLSDQIEEQLLPLFPRWTTVAVELEAGIARASC
jgi:hypothetical protein